MTTCSKLTGNRLNHM